MHRSRLLMRAGQEYVLHSLILIGKHFGGDTTRGAVWLAINCASTGYLLDQAEGVETHAAEDDPVPNEKRRPISRLAISQTLGIPFETVRRHCLALLADGWCLEVKGGLIVDERKMSQAAFTATREANMRNVRRFLRRLRTIDGMHAGD